MSVLPEERELTMPCLLVLVQMLQSCGTSSRGRESTLKDAVPHTRVDGEAMLYENYQVSILCWDSHTEVNIEVSFLHKGQDGNEF